MMKTLFTVIFLVFGVETGEAYNTGRRFLVVFIESMVDESHLDLFFTTSSSGLVDVRVSAPLRPDLLPTSSVQVTRGQTQKLRLDPRLNAVGSAIGEEGILIESLEDISVQAYSQSFAADLGDSTGGFMVLPVTALGKEHMVFAECVTYACLLGITTEVDTTIDIEMMLPPGKFVTYAGTNYYNMDVINIDLHAFQVFQLMTNEDFTGTYIRSKDNVAVVIGSDWTVIERATNLPANNGDGDFIIEQMPPIQSWGCNYVLVNIPGRTIGDQGSILALEENITVYSSSGNIFPVPYRTKFTADVGYGIQVELRATGKFMVALFNKSPENKFVTDTDPAMILVPSVQQWLKSYNVIVPDLTPTTDVASFLVLYAPRACIGNVRISGTVVADTSWVEIVSTNYMTYFVQLNIGVYLVESTDLSCPGFSGFVYGKSYKSAIALPIGGYYGLADKPCVSLSTQSMTGVSLPESTTIDLPRPTLSESPSTSEHPNPVLVFPSTRLLETMTIDISSTFELTSTELPLVISSDLGAFQQPLSTLQMSSETNELYPSNSFELSQSVSDAENLLTTNYASETATVSLETISDFETIISSFRLLSTELQSSSAYSTLVMNIESSGVQDTMSSSLEIVTMIVTATSAPKSKGTRTITKAPVTTSTLASSTSETRTMSPLCRCGCLTEGEDEEEIWMRIEQIRHALLVDKTLLSKTIRKKISIPDERRSSAVIGWGAIMFISSTLFILTAADCLSFVIYLSGARKQELLYH